MTEPTLEFIAKQNERILTEIGTMRDELRVQGAIIMRVDSTLLSLLREMHDTHALANHPHDRPYPQA